MELRALLRTMVVRWWLILPTFLIAFGSSVVFTLSQTPIYQTSSSYFVKPSATFTDNVLEAITALGRQSEVAATYAEVVNRGTIKPKVAELLNLTDDQRRALDLEARLVPGTLLLELSVRSPDPVLARDFCNAAGKVLIDHASRLYEVYALEEADLAGIPDRPVVPNIPVSLAIGAGIALLLALGLAFAAQIISSPPKLAAQMNIIDRQSGAYNEPYFNLRLRQEMSRARRSSSPVSIALVNVNHHGALDQASQEIREEALRRLTAIFEAHVRTEDVVARLGDTEFGLILPDLQPAEAVDMVEGVRVRLAVPSLDLDDSGQLLHARGAAGVATFAGGDVEQEQLLANARSALRESETSPSGQVAMFGGAQQHKPTPVAEATSARVRRLAAGSRRTAS